MGENSISILLIEDNAEFASGVEKRLTEAKAPAFSVKWVPSLNEGLKALDSGDIQAILLDLNLPDSKGFATLGGIQTRAGHLPIIVLTGEFDEAVGPEALKLGAQDYFVKDRIETSALTRSIQYAIERKRLETELKNANAELGSAYEKIKQLYGLIPSILIGIDRNNTITHWNMVAQRLFEKTSVDMIGKPLEGCAIEWDHATLRRGIDECRKKKRIHRFKEDISFTYPSGKQGLLGFTFNPVKHIAGDATDMLLYGADVTQRRQVEARLAQ